MNGCVESGPFLVQQQLEGTLEALAQAVAALLQRLAPSETVASETDESGYRFSVPLRFSDGIGRGAVTARLFRYREAIRLDVEVIHNRVFAKADGSPSDRRCYMNDFVASIRLNVEDEQLPTDFERSVLRGAAATRTAVQRHNRDQNAPWNQVRVAARED